jgi:hypothetical protein
MRDGEMSELAFISSFGMGIVDMGQLQLSIELKSVWTRIGLKLSSEVERDAFCVVRFQRFVPIVTERFLDFFLRGFHSFRGHELAVFVFRCKVKSC